MRMSVTVGRRAFTFRSLVDVLARANRERSGDRLAGIAADSAEERIAARRVLAAVPLEELRRHPALPPDEDAVSRVVEEGLDEAVYRRHRSKTAGELRDFVLSAPPAELTAARLGRGLTPEMAASAAKLMSNLDLVHAAARIPVVARANTTLGLPGRVGVRIQPNHPTDDLAEMLAQTAEGLSFGCGDALIGVNPAREDEQVVRRTLEALDALIARHQIPTQACVLAHVTTQMRALAAGAPMGLLFQSLAGTEAACKAFGITVELLDEAAAMARERCKVAGPNALYFETGQGSELSSRAHAGVDQVTLEARCYGLARRYAPFAVNTVVGFIGPEYLFDASQTQRAGLEDHFMGKLLGVPMGVDACQTNHMEGDQDDVENQALLLAAAGANYFMGVPMGDDVMLGYRSTSFHDLAALRETLGRRPAPEFERWLEARGLMQDGRLTKRAGDARPFLAGGRDAKVARPITRIGVGRVGVRPPLAAWLDLGAGMAGARDALCTPLPRDLHLKVGGLRLRTAARDDKEFLRDPDVGRRLAKGEGARLAAAFRSRRRAVDVLPVLLSGLSPGAVAEQGPPLLARLRDQLERRGRTLARPVVVDRARLKVADEIGRRTGARIVVALIGDRPGLRVARSLSAYVTARPGPRTTDADRAMISNIHAEGLTANRAAAALARLIDPLP